VTGKVLPVGGIRAKIMAANRSNIKTVILPLNNRKDYENLPDQLKMGFDAVHFASDYQDIFKVAFDVK
jgi:ATP-dependent Lon protease